MKQLFRIVNLVVFPLTLLTGVILLLSTLAPFLHPRYSTWLQMLGLAFPVLFLLNILWLFYWWFQMKLKLLAPLCFAILSLYSTSKYVQYTRVRKAAVQPMRIATFNSQLFGVYQNRWFFDTVVREVRDRGFDVVCLQEVYAKKGLEEHVKSLRKNGNFKMYSLFRLSPNRNYGMVILSKFKIVHSGRIDFPGNTGNMAMFTDILTPGNDTVRVYNVHLQSIRFRKTDYDFVNGVEKAGQSNLEKSKGLILRMREAYEKRAIQADSVAAHIRTCKYPVVVCGDFNDVPLSYAYYTVSKGLYDAFREAGKGIERTYKGPFPSFRIDYILFSKTLYCTRYESVSQIPGDHKLVWAELETARKP